MSKYLKMADVFEFPVLAEIQRADFSVISSSSGVVIGGFELASMSTSAAHAINTHDELVAMNQELLEALELAREFLKHPGGATGCLWFEANEKTSLAIAKAKGQ